jgi:hypothetical protein
MRRKTREKDQEEVATKKMIECRNSRRKKEEDF